MEHLGRLADRIAAKLEAAHFMQEAVPRHRTQPRKRFSKK
jgi:hypothetical protein